MIILIVDANNYKQRFTSASEYLAFLRKKKVNI